MMMLATPVSSSRVAKITPLAVPGRWRAMTRPQTVARVSGVTVLSASLGMIAGMQGRSSFMGCALSESLKVE